MEDVEVMIIMIGHFDITECREQMTSGVVCGQVGTNYPRGLRHPRSSALDYT